MPTLEYRIRWRQRVAALRSHPPCLG